MDCLYVDVIAFGFDFQWYIVKAKIDAVHETAPLCQYSSIIRVFCTEVKKNFAIFGHDECSLSFFVIVFNAADFVTEM